MNEQIKPEAFFDSLSLAHKLDNSLDGFKIEELHLFAYFASILYIYKGNPLADWGYRFIIDNNGYPFSDEINESIKRHFRNGLFESSDNYCSITGRGTDEFKRFEVLDTFNTREEYLNAACTTSILVPYSKTQRALLHDSELNKVREIGGERWVEQNAVYQKFKEISEAVGVPADDLIIPAVTWVNYITESENL